MAINPQRPLMPEGQPRRKKRVAAKRVAPSRQGRSRPGKMFPTRPKRQLPQVEGQPKRR